MENNPITDEQLAELDRQYGRAESETGTKIDLAVAMNAAYLAYPALRQRLTDAESRLAEVEKERDEWRTKALDVEQHPVVVALLRERDEAQGLVAGLDAMEKEKG